MTDTVMMIAITAARMACADEPDLEKRIRKAMREAGNFWLSTDEMLRFKAALAGALLETSDEGERARIIGTSRLINAFDASIAGIPITWEEVIIDPLPLLAWWREVRLKSTQTRRSAHA
jgi:hypothetical protein